MMPPSSTHYAEVCFSKYVKLRTELAEQLAAAGSAPVVEAPVERVKVAVQWILGAHSDLYDCAANREIRRRVQQISDLLMDDSAKWPTTIPLAARRVSMVLEVFGPDLAKMKEEAETHVGKIPVWDRNLIMALKELVGMISRPRSPWMEDPKQPGT